MALPVDWVQVPITGTWLDRSGAPCVGTISFTSDQIVVIEGNVVVPAQLSVVLDATGSIPAGFTLPATNDTHLNLTGWAYTVEEQIVGGRCYAIFVPYMAGSIDLPNAAPVVPPPELVGTQGPPNVLTIGTVTTVSSTTPASATITGTSPAQVLDLSIPQGTPGTGALLWGNISGTLSDQTDLETALTERPLSSSLAAVATSGSYTDLSNQPTFLSNPMTAAWQILIGGTGGAPAAFAAPTAAGQVPTAQSNGSFIWAAPVVPSGALLATNNLADLNNVTTARSNLGLGSAALVSTSYFATAAQGALAATAVQPGALATVATTGAYNDLSGKPTLFTNPMSAVGDMIVGGTAGAPTRVAAGTNTYVWTMTSGTPGWAAPSGGGGGGNAYIVDTYTDGTFPTIAAGNGYSLVIGSDSSDASTDGSACNVVIGPFNSNQITTSDFNVLVGYNNTNNTSNCTLLGNSISNSSAGAYAVLVGVSITNTGEYGIAIGEGVTTSAQDAIAIGRATSVTAVGTSGIAIGHGAVSAHVSSVAIGASTTTTKNNQLVVGTSGQQTVISFVAPGTSPTDAVNLAQITPGTSISGTPASLGLFAIVSGVGYMSTGTSSSSDWKQITN